MVQLRLIVFMRKDQPINDVDSEVLFEEAGDRMKLVILKIPAPSDFPTEDYTRWGETFRNLRQKYAPALAVDEKFLSVKLLSIK